MKIKKRKKILFIVKERISYGVSFGLLNSARFVVEVLNDLKHIQAKLDVAFDGNSVNKLVTDYKPDWVILEALWVTPKKLEELIAIHPNVRWVVRLHSNPTFIANEGMAFSHINDFVEMGIRTNAVWIAINDMEFVEALQRSYTNAKFRFLYMPNLYPGEKNRSCTAEPYSDVLRVGLFGAIRPMKNHLNQMLALRVWAHAHERKVELHINSDRLEQGGQSVLNNLRALAQSSEYLTLVEHPWMPHAEFLRLVATMHFGLQVSLSETFNIVAADFVSVGVPIVASYEIKWLSDVLKANPTDTFNIVGRIDKAFKVATSNRVDRLIEVQRQDLAAYNANALKAWEDDFLNLM